MSPDIDRSLAAFEKAMEAWNHVELWEDPSVFPWPEWERLHSILAVHAEAREELRVGAEIPEFMGVLWRFMAQCDYRRVAPWFNGEKLRGTSQGFIFDAAAAAVSSIVIQVVAGVVRSQMRPLAREIMEHAVKMLEKDIQYLLETKKGSAIQRHGLSVIPGGK